MSINTILFIASSLIVCSCTYHPESNSSANSAQNNNNTIRVAFYNTENLFDTIDDSHTRDNEFLPDGKLKWNTKRYEQKISRIREVITSIDQNATMALMGFSEVENKDVLKDVLRHSAFREIHYNSSDPRGIDVCLIYNERFFKPLTSYLCAFNKKDDPELFMREVLLVKGVLLKDTVHVLVNHWPSRRQGEAKTETKRIAAAMLTQEIIDSIYNIDPSANVIVMGDFNDEPENESMSVMLKTKPEGKSKASDLTNPFIQLKKEGKGTCRYKHNWFLFDQILISNSFNDKKGVQYINANIFNPDWLYYKKDLTSGPYRTYVGDTYYGGYSDHFPVFIEMKTK